MRRPAYHHDHRGRLEVKMTPMIDVIFLLLIFFVCTAGFRPVEEVLPTPLSRSGTGGAEVETDPEWEDLDQIVVRVLWQQGRVTWRINERDYQRLDEVRAVLEAMAKLASNVPVILDVDGAVPLEHVIDLCDLCRQIGLEQVRFAVSEDA